MRFSIWHIKRQKQKQNKGRSTQVIGTEEVAEEGRTTWNGQSRNT
jgi:hypothetical protein